MRGRVAGGDDQRDHQAFSLNRLDPASHDLSIDGLPDPNVIDYVIPL